MRKRIISILLCMVMVGAMAGCGSSNKNTSNDNSGTAEVQNGETSEDGAGEETDTKPFEGEKITILFTTSKSTEGFEAVFKAAEEKLGFEIDAEFLPGGEDSMNVVRARLVSGDMADILGYNSGSLLAALNPEEYFEDITADFKDRLVDSFASSASVNGVLYGIPAFSSESGAVLYNIEMYEKYNLEVPKTWDEFLANCDVLKAAGETAVLGTDGDSWTSQVPYLGDHYNVVAAEPDFAERFEAGNAKYAETEVGLASFQKIQDLIPYMNSDHMATTYDNGVDIMMEGGAAHWFMLTSALSNMYELYGDDVNKIGCFAIPGTDAENCGLTVWNPGAFYMNKNAENPEAVKAFMEFYISDEGLDIFTAAELPVGPYCVKNYELPDECYTAVKQMQKEYFETGLNTVALEFQTAVKGANCSQICQELASGQTTAEQAAAKYDEDCKKQALQLGLDW